MQSASTNFADAASGATVTWLGPTVRADWGQDGFGAATDYGIPTRVQDLFDDRTVAGGLGSANASSIHAQAWINSGGSDSDYAVSGGTARHIHTAADVAHYSLLDFDVPDSDVLVPINFTPAGSGGGARAGIVTRYSSPTSHYEFAVEFFGDEDFDVGLVLVKRDGAAVRLALAAMSFPAASQDFVWIRAQTSGDMLRAKAWTDDTGPPAGWDLEYTDTGTTITTGKVGLRSSLTAGWVAPLPRTIAFPQFQFVSGAIDNLSDQVDDSYEVTHALDDGMPEAVAFVSGTGVPEMSIGVADGRDGLTPAQYFSPFNETSPVYGYDRDVAPVTLDQGLITPAGPEEVRLFTGQMTNINGSDMSAISATRLKLAKLVQPPPVYAALEGGDSTWLITWALHECGVYPSPPARDGCVFHATMHGSIRPSIPADQDTIYIVSTYDFDNQPFDLEFIQGPYVLAPDVGIDATRKRRVEHQMSFQNAGADALTRTGNKGRFECWVKGDATNVNAAPGGPGSQLVSFRINNFSPGLGIVQMGINNSRHPFVRMIDGTSDWTYTGSQTLPSDGGWYFFGCAYNFAAGAATVNLNGTVSASAANIFHLNDLPVAGVADGFKTQQYTQFAYLPVAECQLTTGPNADPANADWLNELPWDVGAVVYPSANRFAALVETQATEAWELIAARARTELGSIRCDEQDLFYYLPASYWALTGQQTSVEALSTDVNAGPLNVVLDPTKIRNTVQVSYQRTEVTAGDVPVYQTSEVIVVPRGITTLEITLTTPAVRLQAGTLTSPSQAQIDGEAATPDHLSWVTFNSLIDGSGTLLIYPKVYARVKLDDANTARLTLTNNTNATVYIVNNGTVPYLSIAGRAVMQNSATQTATDAASVAARGERSLTVSIPEIQRPGDAQQIAGILVGELARAVPVLENVTLFGDPRRQPGDLVTVDDPTQTKANGRYRLSSVVHRKNGATFTQIVRARRALPLAVWDQTNWDESIWAE